VNKFFFVKADDGVRLWIDNKKIIDAWWDQETTSYSGAIHLDKGKQYDIRIEYYNGPLHAVFVLSWEQPDESGYTFMGFTFFKTRTQVPANVFSVNTADTVQMVKLEKPMEPATRAVKKDTPSSNTAAKTKTTNEIQKKRVTSDPAIATNEPIEMKSVEFEQTKFDLQETAYKELNALTEYLQKHPKLKIKIIGHTDYAGDSTANYLLSEQRANAIADYLKANGVSQQRITVVAMGSSKPRVVHEKTHQRGGNRRVEFVLNEE
jgi:outer membrane protein OmpA-like peptidoglycan-associated protein